MLDLAVLGLRELPVAPREPRRSLYVRADYTLAAFCIAPGLENENFRIVDRDDLTPEQREAVTHWLNAQRATCVH